MSVETDGASYLLRTSGPTDGTNSFWVQGLPVDATYNIAAFLRQTGTPFWALDIFTNPSGEANADIYATGGDDLNPLGTTYLVPWTFVALVWDTAGGSTALKIYVRHEGDSSLTVYESQRPIGTSAPDEWYYFNDPFGGFAPSGARVSAIKAWSTVLSANEILAESQQSAPLDGTNLYLYVDCALGSTIGQDTSGNGNNFTVFGSGLTLSSVEPSWQITTPALAFGNFF